LGASPPNPTREKEARGNTPEKGGALPPQPPGAPLRGAWGLCPQTPEKKRRCVGGTAKLSSPPPSSFFSFLRYKKVFFCRKKRKEKINRYKNTYKKVVFWCPLYTRARSCSTMFNKLVPRPQGLPAPPLAERS